MVALWTVRQPFLLLPLPGYDALSLEHRVSMLSALCHLAIDSPSIRQGAAWEASLAPLSTCQTLMLQEGMLMAVLSAQNCPSVDCDPPATAHMFSHLAVSSSV